MRFPMRSFVLCREGVPVKNVGTASKVTLVATPIIPFDAENRGDNLLLDTNHFDLDICMLRWCNDAGRGQCNRYRRVNLASSGLSGATPFGRTDGSMVFKESISEAPCLYPAWLPHGL